MNSDNWQPSIYRRLLLATRVQAFIYAFQGLAAAWRTQPAFRIETVFAAVLIPAAFFIPFELAIRLLLCVSCLLVLLTELINSAVEAAIDRIGPEIHPLSGRAKDLAAAAVLISLGSAALCWGAVLINWYLG